MHTLCVVGDGDTAVVEALAARLKDTREGRVATIEQLEHEVAPRADAPDTAGAFGIGTDGTWVGTGAGRSVSALLDSIAPEYDYALVAGVGHHRLPTVVLGDAAVSSHAAVVARAASPEGLDTDALLDQLDEFEPHVTLETLIQQAKASSLAERSGAIATFTGRVRIKDSPDDARTEQLAFEKYDGVAQARMDAISAELTEREGVFEVLMHHRVGAMAAGEDIVFVVVLAGHREEAFRAVEDGINRLKDEVPIFKKETTEDEEFWLHEKP